MKLAVFTAIALSFVLVACKQDQGQHLGNFKNWCADQNGVLAQVNSTDYTCTVGDKVYNSK